MSSSFHKSDRRARREGDRKEQKTKGGELRKKRRENEEMKREFIFCDVKYDLEVFSH